MANKGKTGPSPRQENRLARRNEIWPDADTFVWKRSEEVGWVPVLPRVVPQVAALANHLAPKGKGDPGLVYLDLWFRTDEDSWVRIQRADDMAAGVGFTGQRMERSWNERMEALEELGLIRLHRNESTEEIIAVLLAHPARAVERLFSERNDIPSVWRTAWRQRLDEIQIPPG
jgi:hypothetical protein